MRLIQIIKNIIDKLFKRQKIKRLEAPKEDTSVQFNKEESLALYKDIKDEKVEIESLTKEQLVMFLLLGEKELQFLNKKIDNEKTQCNIYKRNIEYLKQQLEQIN